MNSYSLRFEPDSAGWTERIEFEAEGADDALIIAHLKAQVRSAELWRGEEKLCSIRRITPASWTAAPAQDFQQIPVAEDTGN